MCRIRRRARCCRRIASSDPRASLGWRLAATPFFPGITDCPAWPALNAQLQRLVIDGVDAIQVLHDEAVLVRRDHSHDLAAVLASRLDAHQRAAGPLPWLPPVPRRLAEDDFWGRYFDRRDELINHQGSAVRAAATRWTPQTAPAWAVPTLSDANLTRDLAIWRAARDIPDTDLRPTGPPTNDRAGSHHQRQLERRAEEAGGLQTALVPATARLAETIHPGITADPHWPTLADHIAAARHAGIDRAELRRIGHRRPLADRSSPPPRSRTASSTRSASARRRRRTRGRPSPRTTPVRATATALCRRPTRPARPDWPDPTPVRRPVSRRVVGAIPCHTFCSAGASHPRPSPAASARRAALSSTRRHRIPQRWPGQWHRHLVYSATGTGVCPDAGRCR